MNNPSPDFIKEYKDTINKYGKYCYYTIARELKIEAINQLNLLMAKTTSLKVEAKENAVEESANKLLSMEKTVQAIIYELEMWVALTGNKPEKAWTALMCAQTSIEDAVKAHDDGIKLENYIERLIVMEKLLFPPQIFTSMGAIIKRSTCSICKTKYGECNHLQGRVYMGEICLRQIDELEHIETSVVPNASNKHCRMVTIFDEGVTRDSMTWREITSHEDYIRELIQQEQEEAEL